MREETLSGIELIAQERKEQIEKHGRSLDYDKSFNNHFQLSEAARNLCWLDENEICQPPIEWGDEIWDKMNSKPYKERLIIAGALIAAELDRLNSISK